MSHYSTEVSLEILRIALEDTASATLHDHGNKISHSYHIHRANVVGSRFLLSIELSESDAEKFSQVAYQKFGIRMHKVDRKDIVYDSIINRSIDRQRNQPISPRYSRFPSLIYEFRKPELSSWLAEHRQKNY